MLTKMSRMIFLRIKFEIELIIPSLNKLLLTNLNSKIFYSTITKNQPIELNKVNKRKENKLKHVQITTTLGKLLNLNTLEAYKMLKKYKKLYNVENALINNNYNKLIENGINVTTIQKYPELLTENVIENKIKILKKLPYDINSIIVLSMISSKKIQIFTKNELMLSELNNRLDKLPQLFEVDIETLCSLICQKPFLFTMDINKIEENIKLLLSFGISTESIRNDLWVLRYSKQLISNKLTLAKNHNIEELKTWMVRVQSNIFETYIRRRSDNKLILGNNSLAEYLSERLECSVEVAKNLIIKQPVLKNKSLKKIKEIIDLLYSKGFKPSHICRVPKILSHSTQTTRERLQLLDSKGLQLDSVHVLTKSQKQFKQYYDALLIKNKKK